MLAIGGMPARTHASQGEQRSLSLALRLAAHELVTEFARSAPILLLDDVFSELDPGRSGALLESLPAGQTLLTSAGGLPPGADPELVLVASRQTVERDPDLVDSMVEATKRGYGFAVANPKRALAVITAATGPG